MRKLTKLVINGTNIVLTTGKVIDHADKTGTSKIVRFNTDNPIVRGPAWDNKEVQVQYFTPGEAGVGPFILTFTGRDYKLESSGEIRIR